MWEHIVKNKTCICPSAVLKLSCRRRVMTSGSTSLLVLDSDAPGHVLYYRVTYLDLQVISAVHVVSYQTWLKLSASHESCLGVNMMYFSGASSGWTRSLLLWWNYSGWTRLPKGAVVERWQFGGCVIAESVVIWVIIEPARHTTMQHIPALALIPLQAWKPIKMHCRKVEEMM